MNLSPVSGAIDCIRYIPALNEKVVPAAFELIAACTSAPGDRVTVAETPAFVDVSVRKRVSSEIAAADVTRLIGDSSARSISGERARLLRTLQMLAEHFTDCR